MLERVARRAVGAANAARLLGPATRVEPPPEWRLTPQERARLTVHWPRDLGWTDAVRWVGPIRHGIERLVPVVETEIEQRHTGVLELGLSLDAVRHVVVLDYSDYLDYDRGLLERASLYFKMQCPLDEDPRLIPGGYITWSDWIYRYLRRLRALRDAQRFEFDVFGRFSSKHGEAVRRKAVELLQAQRRFRYEGGLKLAAYPTYLREIARARVCIDLPGLGPLCFRQLDCLAIGSCIIGPRPRVAFPVAPVDGRDIVYTREDLSDLVDLCEHYVTDDAARERVARSARRYFDTYMSREALGAHYLRTAIDRLSPAAVPSTGSRRTAPSQPD